MRSGAIASLLHPKSASAAISAGLEGASSSAAGDLVTKTGTQHIPIIEGAGPVIGGSAAVTGES